MKSKGEKERYTHLNAEFQRIARREKKAFPSDGEEMARVNIDILGIRELKWTGMGEFNLDDHYIYSCGQEFLRGNEAALIVNKTV